MCSHVDIEDRVRISASATQNQWHIILLVRTAKPQQCDLGEAKRVRQKGKQKEGASARSRATASAAREKLSTFGARMSLLDRILAEGLPADPITHGA